MTSIRPRKFLHRGQVEAAGFLFDTELIGTEETRQRILNLWNPGVRIYSSGSNQLVCLPSATRVECANSIATPLVQIEGVLSALPLSPDELDALHAPSHSVVISKGGVAYSTPLSSLGTDNPEAWLDVSAFKVVEVTSLGSVFADPKVVAEPQPFDARTKLDGVPPETSELREVIAAIKAASNETKSANWSATREVSGWISGLIGSISMAIGKLLGSSNLATKASTTRYTSRAPEPSKLQTWLTRVGMRFLHTSRLAHLLGRRQAAYLRKMMDMFESGDLNEALKHAIPLGDLSSLSQQPALGVPQPRTSLAILPWQRNSPRSIGLGNDVMVYLNQLYRASVERLVAQKRIEEAAFVLAELLRANGDAVTLLERHGKLKLAAELAEARELPPGLVVRQWFIAGDIKRAVEIARRTEAFADAVLRLERTEKDQAAKLRLLWAVTLAEGGNYASAVDVIWPLEMHRKTAREWMEKAIEVGGSVAARMLVRKLLIAPEEFDGVRRRALTFLDDENLELSDTRASFANELMAGVKTTEAQTLARVAARAILRDAGQNCSPLTARQFTRLVNFSGDGSLRTDVTPFPVASGQWARGTLSVNYQTADCGSMAVHDALLLADGRMLVALGEIGVRLLNRDGRTVTHFDHPADRLVISDNGDRAIALARRGEMYRLSRLDLISWRGEDWCDARIDAFAPNYDGSLWFLGANGDFYAIDAHAKTFEALWRVPDAGSRVLSVARSESSCSFLSESSELSGTERWLYRLPSLTLKSRILASKRPDDTFCVKQFEACSPEGSYADQSLYFQMDPDEPHSMQSMPTLTLRAFDYDLNNFELVATYESGEPLTPEILGRNVVSPVLEKEGVRVRIIDLHSQEVTAELFFESSSSVSTRLTEKAFTVADNLGRLIVVDLRRNMVMRSFRI